MPYATSKFKKIELEPGEEWVAGAFGMPAGGASRQPDMLWGRPKNVAFAVPLSDIASVSLAEPGKLSQQATFVCKDGRTLTVEAMTKGKSWLRELVTKAEALLR